MILLLLISTSCAPPETVHVDGTVVVFDFLYHYTAVVNQAERLAGVDFFSQPEEARDELWDEALRLTVGQPCESIGDFPDVRSDTAVTVLTDGEPVGSTTLGQGFTDLLEDQPGHFLVVCRFDFDIEVPAAERYEVVVDGISTTTAAAGTPVKIFLGFSTPPEG